MVLVKIKIVDYFFFIFFSCVTIVGISTFSIYQHNRNEISPVMLDGAEDYRAKSLNRFVWIQKDALGHCLA